MVAPKAASIKPFMLEKKEGPRQVVSETSVNKWIGCLVTNIKKETDWCPFTASDYSWDQKKVVNRGKADAATARNIEAMLEYISQYTPNCLYWDITVRSKSMEEIWTLVRKWAGIKTVGCYQQKYFQMKRSYNPSGDVTPTDFYFMLRNCKEDCLFKSVNSGGQIPFQGQIPDQDEELSPTLECDVVAD